MLKSKLDFRRLNKMKVIAVTGAQGSGKSTLLEKLKTKDLQVDDFKVSRAVQTKLGWDSLTEVLTSPGLMMKFQEMVLHEKFSHDKKLAAASPDSELVFVERSFADIYAYTELWFDRLGMRLSPQYVSWLNSYETTCKLCQTIYSGVIMVPLMKEIKWEDDPKRASKADAEVCYGKMLSFVSDFTKVDPQFPSYTIKQSAITKRVTETLNFLQTIKQD